MNVYHLSDYFSKRIKRFAFILLLGWPVVIPASAQSDTVMIKKHLAAITKTDGFRNHQNIPLLNEVAALRSFLEQMLQNLFLKYCFTTFAKMFGIFTLYPKTISFSATGNRSNLFSIVKDRRRPLFRKDCL